MSRLQLRISDELALPAHEAQTQTIVVYGGKGMGKTNFGAVVAEELAGNDLRFSWIDPIGVAWGLKHSRDGRGAGVEVLILGGRHGDIPINPQAGAIVADLVVDEQMSVIIDISSHPDGRRWTQGEKIRFVRDYFTRLYERQGEKRRPLMQIVDEAGRFVPQNPPKGAVDIMECIGAIEVVVEEGRNVGLGVTLITQRSARMNKSVSELAEIMIAFRTVGPRSIDAIIDWFGEHVPKERQRALIERLRELPKGTALVVSPGWLGVEGEYAIRARETFDSSDTPKAGQERRPRGRGASVDVDKYAARMADVVEAAKENDPAELRKRIRELERAQGSGPRVEQLQRESDERLARIRDLEGRPAEVVEVPAIDKHDLTVLVNTVRDLQAQIADVLAFGEYLNEAAKPLLVGLEKVTSRAERAQKVKPTATTAHHPPAPARPAPRMEQPSTRSADDVQLKAGARRILETFARHHPMRMTKAQLGTLAKFKITGGTFQTYWSTLKRAGYVEESGRECWITAAGLDYVGHVPQAPMTTEEVLDQWRGALKAGARQMLDALVNYYDASLSKEELAEHVGMTASGGTFQTYLSTLRRNGLVDVDGDQVRASDTLFIGATA